MAWKLKKWKGTEAEEQEAPEQVFEIADEAPAGESSQSEAALPVFSEPEPSQAFDAAQFTRDSASPVVPPAPNGSDLPSSVIPLAPPAEEAPAAPHLEPAYQDPDFSPAQSVHDLTSSIDTGSEPIDFPTPGAESSPGAPAHDYFAASASSDHSAFAEFQPESAQEEDTAVSGHADFDLDDAPLQPIELPPPSSAASPAATAASEPKQAATPQPESDSLDAFAPYRPASAPPPAASTPDLTDPVFAPVPAASDNGLGSFHATANPDIEDTLSFAPISSSRVIVKIGPFAATYEVNKPEMTIGRPDAKTGTSPDISLEWDDAVSRRHARIVRGSDGDYIEDVGSSNGTLLNGQPIAVNSPILLKDGDVITIGERTQISYLR